LLPFQAEFAPDFGHQRDDLIHNNPDKLSSMINYYSIDEILPNVIVNQAYQNRILTQQLTTTQLVVISAASFGRPAIWCIILLSIYPYQQSTAVCFEGNSIFTRARLLKTRNRFELRTI
jgi:hypothetical protein